jgi:hypothetical protein
MDEGSDRPSENISGAIRRPHQNNSGQQGCLNQCRPYSDDGDRRRRRDLSIAIIMGVIGVRQY